MNNTLRRVTLIQNKVEKDINLYEVYKKLHGMRDILNKHYNIPNVPIADIYPKHIYNPDTDQQCLVNQKKILSFAKKHNWSAFEQYSIYQAA